jgi:hypothetical protein
MSRENVEICRRVAELIGGDNPMASVHAALKYADPEIVFRVGDRWRRLVRYRASPRICNACPAKAECTDSDRGREIAQPLDPWPHSEAGRFHRGICVVLVALAVLISAIALVRSDGTADLITLSTMLGSSIAVTGRLLGAFRRTPDGFPVAPSASPDPSIAARSGPPSSTP